MTGGVSGLSLAGGNSLSAYRIVLQRPECQRPLASVPACLRLQTGISNLRNAGGYKPYTKETRLYLEYRRQNLGVGHKVFR